MLAHHASSASCFRRAELLKKLVQCEPAQKRQTNCLFEVQRFCSTAGWPQNLAKKTFYALYEQEIVEEVTDP